MIVGVGVDIVSIDKIRKALQKWDTAFLSRIFNEEEIAHIPRGKMYYQRIGARFAAKEAVFKAISTTFPLNLKEIIILSDKNGAPYCQLRKEELSHIHVSLSLTHIEEYALACAVAEKKS